MRIVRNLLVLEIGSVRKEAVFGAFSRPWRRAPGPVQPMNGPVDGGVADPAVPADGAAINFPQGRSIFRGAQHLQHDQPPPADPKAVAAAIRRWGYLPQERLQNMSRQNVPGQSAQQMR
jgi:hypothetical protein